MFHDDLKNKRLKRGLAQRELERKTNGVISTGELSQYERGRHVSFISFRKIVAISRVLHWPLDEMAKSFKEEWSK